MVSMIIALVGSHGGDSARIFAVVVFVAIIIVAIICIVKRVILKLLREEMTSLTIIRKEPDHEN
jgi:uncharacterized membrane protein